ncbi:mechanosensitive ion channel family protein, partial [Ideonella azotifigens]
MWTLIAMALAALLWLVVVTLGHGVDAEPDGINLTAIQLAAMSLTALSVAQLLQRLLSHLLLGKSATQGAGRSSDLLRSVLNVTLYLVVGVLFLHYGLGQDVTSVLATSALLTAILGLALQPTLGHLFSGVSIEIERPLRVGDYVRRDELEGRVVSLSWRSVSLETDRGTLLVMPNAEFTSRSVEIIRASQPSRHQIVFHMASNCSPSQVLRVAMQVLRSDITDIVPVPAPSVVILGSDPLTGTLRFAARFFTLKFLDRSRIASLFMERLWFALSREGLALPQRPMLGSTEEAAGWHLMPDHGPAQEQLLAAELPLPAAAGRAAAPQPAAMRGLVAQSLAGVPAALRQELLAAGQLALYGPDERCNRRQAGVLVQGQLAQDRPPQPEQRQRELDWLRAQVAPLPSQSPSQLLSAEAMVMEPDHFERFVQRAALAMGPLAHSLCLRIALHTDDLSLAHALLAESI